MNITSCNTSRDQVKKTANGESGIDDEDQLKRELGEKYADFKPMVEQVKKNLKRVAALVKISKALDCKIQHAYVYRLDTGIHIPRCPFL